MIAYLRQEPGSKIVEPYLRGSSMSAVNVAEVFKLHLTTNSQVSVIQAILQNLSIQVIPFDERQAVMNAELAKTTQSLGLSLGDRACLNLGLQLNVKVLTGDRQMAKADMPVEIVLIRQPN